MCAGCNLVGPVTEKEPPFSPGRETAFILPQRGKTASADVGGGLHLPPELAVVEFGVQACAASNFSKGRQ